MKTPEHCPARLSDMNDCLDLTVLDLDLESRNEINQYYCTLKLLFEKYASSVVLSGKRADGSPDGSSRCRQWTLDIQEALQVHCQPLGVRDFRVVRKIKKGRNWASGNFTQTTKHNASVGSRRLSMKTWYHSDSHVVNRKLIDVPQFERPIGNHTFHIGKEAVLGCSVINLGKHKYYVLGREPITTYWAQFDTPCYY
uniref:SFRICE_011827 n=1 Tax=Spodoptera frugiperda TaxID=7108 RepID=A0A2H1VW75_SPOFR